MSTTFVSQYTGEQIESAISKAILTGYGTTELVSGTTAAYTVTLDNENFILDVGSMVAINFNQNVSANATLNINSTGAKPIYYSNEPIKENTIKQHEIILLVFNGTVYNVISADSNKLSLEGGIINGNLAVNAVNRDSFHAYNLCRYLATTNVTPTELVIKTKIKFSNLKTMPVIHLFGYSHNLGSIIDLAICWSIADNSFNSFSASALGYWKPDIYLYKYTINNEEFVGIGLKNEDLYYLGFQVDAQIGCIGAFDDYFSINNWSVENTQQIPAVGTDSCVLVPYKELNTNITGSASHASEAENTTKVLNEEVTFKDLTITDGDTTTTFKILCKTS